MILQENSLYTFEHQHLITLLFSNTDTMSGVEQTHSWKVRTLKLCVPSLGWQTCCCFLATFQFTHKSYTTSPENFQAQEHALLPVSESEGKTLFLHKFITLNPVTYWGFCLSSKKGLSQQQTQGCPVHLDRGAGLAGWQHTQPFTKLCKPEPTAMNSPKPHSWRAGSS